MTISGLDQMEAVQRYRKMYGVGKRKTCQVFFIYFIWQCSIHEFENLNRCLSFPCQG